MNDIPTRDLIAPRLNTPQRLDQFLIRQGIHKSRSYLQKRIREGDVTVNGQVVRSSYQVHSGDRIHLQIPTPVPIEIGPEPIPLEIVYEDPYLILINKPAGLVVHPAPGHFTGTLVNALLYHCRELSEIGGRERPGIVHRLDKGTTGLMVVAKTDAAHRGLSRQFASHTIRRAYWALVRGSLRKKNFPIDLAIGRDRKDRKKISPRTTRPKHAVTVIHTLRRLSGATLVEARPRTGRTHQIRVHLAGLGHPVLGDRVYGGRGALKLGTLPINRPI